MKLRSALYRAARIAGDIQAVSSGKPGRITKRLANKAIGRSIVRRMWFR